MSRALLLASLLFAFSRAHAVDTIIAVGSANVAAPLVASAQKLREDGVELKVSTDQQNSTTAIAAVGSGLAQLAIVTRPVTAGEHAEYSKVRLPSVPFCYQVQALVVSRDVWLAGVHALTREQAQRIYEGEIKNWKELGGEDRPIKFFNPEQGRGVWEMFTTWIYGDSRKAPLGENFEKVASDEETRNLVEFTGGSLSLVCPLRIDQQEVFALAIKSDSGELLQPTLDRIRADTYPLGRRLDFVTAERPTGALRRTIDFFSFTEGREILQRYDLVPLDFGK